MSASRAKEWITLYTDDKAEIRDAVKRSSQKLAALDLRPKRQEAKAASWPEWWSRFKEILARRRRQAAIDRVRSAWETRPPAFARAGLADHAPGRVKNWAAEVGRSNRPGPIKPVPVKATERGEDHGFSR